MKRKSRAKSKNARGPKTRGTTEPAQPEIPRESKIAAIGASAGGLGALSELFQHVPKDSGIAFVVIQHLDPTHQSYLTELLSKDTTMPVTQIRDGMSVLPDRIYVIPPDHVLTIHNRVLSLERRNRSKEHFMTVDHFLRSLAQDQGPNAIAVILSGAGSDGTLGVAEIQGHGGVTLAQDEASAKYDSMPRSAVQSGCIDLVLPPKEMGRELVRIANHRISGLEPQAGEWQASADLAKDSGGLADIFQILRKATSVDFTYYRDTTSQRRIHRRMTLHKVPSLQAYYKLLRDNPDEVKALCQDLLIHVTSFFRNPATFDAIKSSVLPRIVKNRRTDAPIRIWTPGCSSGEETYSLGMILMELLGSKGSEIPIQLFGTDVSETSIAKARVGFYPENIKADVSAERLRRFFVKVDDGYRISKTVRDICIFSQHNLLSDPPFSQIDLICCRNLLIYLEPLLQKKVIGLFHYSLSPGGFLVLGSSEGVGTTTNLFGVEDRANKIFGKKSVAVRPAVSFALGVSGKNPPPPPARVAGKPAEAVWSLEAQMEFDRRLLSQYAPAAVLVNDDFEIVHSRGNLDPYLKLAPGRPSLNVLKMAREGLLYDLRSALDRASRQRTTVRKPHVQLKDGDGLSEITLEVMPVRISHSKETCFMVVFEQTQSLADPALPAGRRAAKRGTAESGRVARLEQELVATKDYLHAVIETQEATNEELQSANEEILSSNEELQSTNEELETAKEELQSTNEELTTVNDELRSRNTETTQMNSDLTNLLAHVDIAIVMLNSDLTIRRFTAPAQNFLGLIPSDVGRPFANITQSFMDTDLPEIVERVIATLQPMETKVKDRSGAWHLLRVLPYRTPDNKIDGAVITMHPIPQPAAEKKPAGKTSGAGN